ncbi:MAG: hypothetical protein PHI22_02290 [Bacilli bacterium]|nr:hypothetical protein [Bacilli bacterium]MDD4298686.1 hypothetical protein [Bacilli bacterium]MDD4644014.1 hypothetical protein [Bacilli bacterium]
MRSFVRGTNNFLPNKSIRDAFIKNLKNGTSVFSYRGYIIRVTYNKQDYLRLSCSENLLDELIPIGNQVMDSNIIASYLMDSDDISELIPTVEWDSDPQNRHMQLIEGTNLGFRCINLQLVDSTAFVKRTRKPKRTKAGLL